MPGFSWQTNPPRTRPQPPATDGPDFPVLSAGSGDARGGSAVRPAADALLAYSSLG